MNQRHAVVSTLFVFAFSSLALSIGLSPRAQKIMAAGTDQQAQARTAADIDRVGAAMLGWLTDQVGAAAAGQSQVPIDIADYPPITQADLAGFLVPEYLPEVPALDGWDHAYDYHLDTANPLAQHVMAIRSPGRNGTFSGTTYTVENFAPDSFDEDLVWADGYQVRWPGSRTDREAQDRTVADVRKIGAAMFSWLTDQVALRVGQAPGSTNVTLSFYTPITHAQLENVLVPQYIAHVPEKDGWGAFYQFWLNVNNPLATEVMAIRSTGGDQTHGASSYTVTEFDRDDFDQDILWADGFFARWPDEHGGLSFYAVDPCRVLDTRSSAALSSGVTSTVQLGGACGIPVSADSVAVTVTIVGAAGSGHVILFPGDTPVPPTSTINFAAGQTRSNNAVLGFSEDGTGSIGARATVAGGGQVHLILDVTGYFD